MALRATKGVEFLSPEYFELYDIGVQQAKKDGLEVVLYDDYSFPSGTAGGLLYSKFPQFAAKSLNMAEEDVTGPKKIDLAIPEGIYMGSVLMNLDTHELVDVSSSGKAGPPDRAGAEGQLEGDGVLPGRRQGSGRGLPRPQGDDGVHVADL